MKGWWFRSLDDCIFFCKKYVPEGQFQWFLDVVSYLQFVTDDIFGVETSKNSDIHEARVRQTPQKPSFIASFWTHVPPVFANPKEYCDSR